MLSVYTVCESVFHAFSGCVCSKITVEVATAYNAASNSYMHTPAKNLLSQTSWTRKRLLMYIHASVVFHQPKHAFFSLLAWNIFARLGGTVDYVDLHYQSCQCFYDITV